MYEYIQFFFSEKKLEFDISCKLSPKEKTCIKYKVLFSGKNMKNILKCSLLKFLLGMFKVLITSTADNILVTIFFIIIIFQRK